MLYEPGQLTLLFALMFLLQKADKRTIDNLVSRTKFDQSIGGLDQSLQDLLQRLEGQVCARHHFFSLGL